jgi:hypothetical protein
MSEPGDLARATSQPNRDRPSHELLRSADLRCRHRWRLKALGQFFPVPGNSGRRLEEEAKDKEYE